MRKLVPVFAVLLLLGCSDGGDAGAFKAPTDAATDGDASTSDAPSTTQPDGGSAADAPAGFPAGEGVKTAVDRSAPCTAAEEGQFRNAPEAPEVVQACLPNYDVWAPVVCGGPLPACTCDASKCASGEVAKLVSGSFCVCLSPCTTQAQGAKCGHADARRCIPVDDVTKKQVFICGGA